MAREYAGGVTPRVILVNGRELAELMLDHGVGVTPQHGYEIKKLDQDYFPDTEVAEPSAEPEPLPDDAE